MNSESVDQLKARIVEFEQENAALSAAARVRIEIHDLVARWRNPTGGISDRKLLHVIGQAFDKRELWTNAGDPLSRTLRSGNGVAFPKATQ